jgi:hypothetical protein
MRQWQKTASTNLDDPTTLELVGEAASACAQTYSTPAIRGEFIAVESIRCDIFLAAAAAYNAASHLDINDPIAKKLDAGHALDAYAAAAGSCSLGKRSQQLQDSVKSSLDQVRSYYLPLPSN